MIVQFNVAIVNWLGNSNKDEKSGKTEIKPYMWLSLNETDLFAKKPIPQRSRPYSNKKTKQLRAKHESVNSFHSQHDIEYTRYKFHLID